VALCRVESGRCPFSSFNPFYCLFTFPDFPFTLKYTSFVTSLFFPCYFLKSSSDLQFIHLWLLFSFLVLIPVYLLMSICAHLHYFWQIVIFSLQLNIWFYAIVYSNFLNFYQSWASNIVSNLFYLNCNTTYLQ
jgi:hypothetical protein